jgi:uncharacterized membrane protein
MIFGTVVFIALDVVNRITQKDMYRKAYPRGLINVPAGLMIYLLYPVCVAIISHSDNPYDTMTRGGVLGATVYGSYHLMNIATVPYWSIWYALTDTAYGVAVTTLLAFLGWN